MKKENLFTTFLLVFVLLFVLVACDGGATTPAAEKPATDEPVVVEPTESESNLTLWVYDDGRLKVLTQLGEKFKAEYGVGLNVEVVDLGEIKNIMALGASSGEGPDMVIIPHDNLGPMVEEGVAVPIELGDKASNFLPNAIDGFTYNGELYGLPLAVENIGFFRNTDMVPDAPKTWDEVAEIGTQLVEDGVAESAIGLPDLTYNVYPLYTSYGGYIFGRDADGNFTPDDIGMANEGMIKGMIWIKDMVDSEVVSSNVDWEASHVLFETGKSAFIMTGPWAINRFKEAGVPYAISAFPAAEEGGEPGYPFLGVQGIVINGSKDNVLMAQAFCTEFLATEENYQAIFDAEPRPSAWTTIFESADDPDTAAFNEAGVNAVPMPAIPAMGYVWDAWVAAGNLVVTGELSPEAALQDAVAQIQTQIDESQ
ncbi:MAG: maltose ABC transporter substrate-binding protein [Anaerolineae bacterium]|nr:maltose ABC transporter substrate-binding protein [Anaerolineae bacterium]